MERKEAWEDLPIAYSRAAEGYFLTVVLLLLFMEV